MSPSAQCLPHTVSLYRWNPGQDSDAGAVPNESSLIAANVPASVQPGPSEWDAVNRRVRQTSQFDVWLTANYGLKGKDLIVWVDALGDTRNLFVSGQSDQIAQGVAVPVQAREIL